MANKKTQQAIKFPWNSCGATNEPFIPFFPTQVVHEAFISLSPNAKVLYMCCRMEYRPHVDLVANKQNDFGKTKPNQFYMNKAIWDKKYKLFNGSDNSFGKYMSELIQHGFIDCVACGAIARQKSLYQYSDRWLEYGTPNYKVPDNVKSIAYRNREKNGSLV